jgi:glutathione S-transferase
MTHRLYINSMSPFSMKASAMIGYAGLDCELRTQNIVTRYATLKRMTGKTMVPTLRRGEWALNDSTRIARHLIEATERPLLPQDARLEPLCWLLEDFADEWFSLWVLQSRWDNPEDVAAQTAEIGHELACGLPGVSGLLGRLAAVGVKKKIRYGGANEANAGALERSRERFLQALETVLEQPPAFLFESYPTVADFSTYGQVSQFERDPTGQEVMRLYPNVRDYLAKMDAMALPHPEVDVRAGGSRDVSSLSGLFAEFLGTYWRLLVANHRAYHQEKRPEQVDVELLDGESFTFRPSGYRVGRLEFVLSQLDSAYAERDELFGGKAVDVEHALVRQVAALTDYPAGRELLRQFPHIGKGDQG